MLTVVVVVVAGGAVGSVGAPRKPISAIRLSL